MERYERVYLAQNNQVLRDCPVAIAAGAILKDTVTGGAIGQLKIVNLTEEILSSLKVTLICYDPAKKEVCRASHFYLDLAAHRDAPFGTQEAIPLPDPTARSFTVIPEQAVFRSGRVWDNTSPFTAFLPAAPLAPTTITTLQTLFGNKPTVFPTEAEGFWLCSCGMINRDGEEKCHRCRIPRGEQFAMARDPSLLQNTAKYKRAKEKMESAKDEAAFREAAELFQNLHGFVDADRLCEICLEKAESARKDGIYRQAEQMMLPGTIEGYESAIRLFETIPGWGDADREITACREEIAELKALKEEQEKKETLARKKRKKIAAIVTPITLACIVFVIVLVKVIIPNGKYDAAVKLYDEGKYEEAITAFQALNGYKDSKEQITKCETAISDAKYTAAVALIEKGDIINAYESLIALNGYKDSTQKANDIFSQYEMAKLKAASIGDIVYFGSYEQDNNKSNGKEDVEWLVLAKEGDRALVISKYALDCQQYSTPYTSVTWETCSLRKWLNGTFFTVAFSPEEQVMIMSYLKDNVFLLSIEEANQYFSSDDARQCQGTAYCYAQGAYKANSGNCWWWLRSPGDYSDFAAIVRSGGAVSDYGYEVGSSYGAVRPAMWIDLGE